MHIDTRLWQACSASADICIIGAGPAGISLALELASPSLKVALLESGGIEFDPLMQQLASGPTHGPVLPSYKVNRRQLGGNANVWGIKLCGPDKGLRHALFDEMDFEARDWVPHSGWPLQRSELMPFYQRAQQVCGAGPFAYDAAHGAPGAVPPLSLAGSALENGLFHFSSCKVFSQTYRHQLLQSEHVTVYTHATVVELMCAGGGQALQSVRVARPGRPDWQLTAKVFVLACGGFENPRLLLMSRAHHPLGVGNAHDVVGRYYHDHLQGRSGYLLPKDPAFFERAALYDMRVVSGSPVMGYLKLSRQMQAQERLLNFNTLMFPRTQPRKDQATEAFNTLRERRLLRTPAHEVVPPLGLRQTLKHAFVAARGLDHVAKMAVLASRGLQATAYGTGHGGWSQLKGLERRFQRLELWHSMEQSPRPENRVSLSRECDMFGRPRVALHWHWPEDDMAQTQRTLDVTAREIERAGWGRVQRTYGQDGLPDIEWPTGSHHLMGTTRMHADPRQGVVNAQCQVHGLANLFVAGSSVFPAGGYANPTLTLVALALRLADHLKRQWLPKSAPALGQGDASLGMPATAVASGARLITAP